MSLRFSYYLFSTKQPIWPLGGRWQRPRPMVLVTVIGPANTRAIRGLLHTGSDDTVFPETLTAFLGIDLMAAPTGEASGVGRAPAILRYAEVALRITDGREQRQWQARVGFTSAPIKQPLIGFAGFLQFFTATFHGDREEVELAVNSLYQGT